MTNKVYFIGAGPGDPELITVKGQRIISQADLVLYAGSLVPKEVVSQARAEAEVIDSAPLTLEQTHELMKKTVSQGGLVARVHTGDPSLYGAVWEQAHLLQQEGIAFEIIPGVSVAFAAAAQAKISFTLPELSQSLVLTRISGRTKVPEKERLAKLAQAQTAMAIYLSTGKAREVAQELLDGGYPAKTLIIIGERIGWPGERIIPTTIDQLEATVKGHQITRQAVFLVLPGQPGPGEQDQGKQKFSRLYAKDFSHGFRQKD